MCRRLRRRPPSSSPRGDRDTVRASSAYSIPQIARRTHSSAVSGPTFDVCSCRWIIFASMPASLLNLSSTTRSIAAKNTLNNSGESTHPWRSPCATSNHSEHRPSSLRTHALSPSWNLRITSITCGGVPKRASTCQRSVRSTESYALCKSTKHRNSGTRALLPNSCSLRTANIISVVERCGRNPHCSSGSKFLASQ